MADLALLSELLLNTSPTKSLQSPLPCNQATWHRVGNGAPLIMMVSCLRFSLLTSDRVDNLLYVSDFAGDEFERLV